MRFDAENWDRLANALNAYGVQHVTPVHWVEKTEALEPATLVSELARSPDPRLCQSLVFLLLTHPEFAGVIQSVIATLPESIGHRAKVLYVVAAASQRLARRRIEQYLGPQSPIPADFLDEFDLPSLDLAFGKETLIQLAQREEESAQYPAWQLFRSLLESFLESIRRPSWGDRAAAH